MAHWYGEVQGSRGPAHRLGGKEGGVRTHCASWSGAVTCHGYVDDDGTDCVIVRLTTHGGQGCSPSVVLYDGPIGHYENRAPSPETQAQMHADCAR